MARKRLIARPDIMRPDDVDYVEDDKGTEPIYIPPPVIPPKPKPIGFAGSRKLWEHTLEYVDLKSYYIAIAEGKVDTVCTLIENRKSLERMSVGWKDKGFYGATQEEMVGWLRKGYHQPGLVLDPPITPVRKKRRLKFAEEGELQIDLMYSGHDYPFLAWTPRDIMPGMKADILVDMNAGTPADVIAAYNRFILRSLIALESAGIDLEVWVSTGSSQPFVTGSDDLLMHVKVKKEGQQTDYLSWSPILSPGGFRHLMFLSLVKGADLSGKNIEIGLGASVQASGWKVQFEHDTRTLKFECPPNPRHFPEAEMEIQLREVLRESRRAV